MTTEPNTDPQPLAAPRHPYLHLAAALDDLRGLCHMLAQSTEELAPVLRSATPPSVQAGGVEKAADERQYFLDPLPLDRCATQLSMVHRSCEVLSGHVQALSAEMMEQGVAHHLSRDDDDE